MICSPQTVVRHSKPKMLAFSYDLEYAFQSGDAQGSFDV